MRPVQPLTIAFTETDLDFLIDAAAPAARDRDQLKRALLDDEAFRQALVADERVFQHVASGGEQFVRISPALYFEVLLRKARRELEQATHTLERSGSQTVAVFDTPEVLDLLKRPGVIEYLAQMLASFTRVESYTTPVRVQRGVWRKVRFNDADIDSLVRMCEAAEEPERLAYYKRIADVCLFILGMFPEHAQPVTRYGPGAQPALRMSLRRRAEDYAQEGRRFYKLAGEHPAAQDLRLAELFWLLHERLLAATKPLNFISGHYLALRKRQVFAAG